MTGADGTYDYKAMAAGIVLAGGEGMGKHLRFALGDGR